MRVVFPGLVGSFDDSWLGEKDMHMVLDGLRKVDFVELIGGENES